MIFLAASFLLLGIQEPVEEQSLETEFVQSSEFVCRQFKATMRECLNCPIDAVFPYEIFVEERVAIIESGTDCTDSNSFALAVGLSLSDSELVNLVSTAKNWVHNHSDRLELSVVEGSEIRIGDIKYISETTFRGRNRQIFLVKDVGFELYLEDGSLLDYYIGVLIGASELGYLNTERCIGEHCWGIAWPHH